MRKAKDGESHALIYIDSNVGPAFQKWCDERGFFVIGDERLSRWASSIKEKRIISKFYGYGGPNEFLNTQDNYTEERESIERKIEICDFMELRASKIISLGRAYRYIKDGSEFFDDYISEFKGVADEVRKSSDPHFLYYECANNMSEEQVEVFCFFSESVFYLKDLFGNDVFFEDIHGEGGVSVSNSRCGDESDKSMFVVRWGDYDFFKNNYEPLHKNDDIWLHPPKLTLDYKLLTWVYDVNADLIFDRIAQWIIKEFDSGNEELVFFIRVYPEDYFAEIYYKGEAEWGIPICPLRFSLAARLRGLPVNVSLVTEFDDEDSYFEEEHDYKVVIRILCGVEGS